MIDLITEAHRFQSLCQELAWRFCFIGGLPVQHWGEPRLTRDIDVTILTGFGGEESFIAEILKHYQDRIEDAAEFALLNRVLLVKSMTGVSLDISLGAFPFEEQIVDRALDVEYLSDLKLRVCTAEDLIVMKSFAGRPQDWQDVSSVIVRQGQKLDWDYITANLEPLAALKEEPAILERLERLRAGTS